MAKTCTSNPSADTPQAGRSRNADPAGQFDIGHPPVGLQLGQNLAVDLIQAMSWHAGPFMLRDRAN
jgi:hypothetical protein